MLRQTTLALILALLMAWPAKAQDTIAAAFDALLPIVVVVGLVMAGVMFWGQKKTKKKPKRRKLRQGRF